MPRKCRTPDEVLDRQAQASWAYRQRNKDAVNAKARLRMQVNLQTASHEVQLKAAAQARKYRQAYNEHVLLHFETDPTRNARTATRRKLSILKGREIIRSVSDFSRYDIMVSGKSAAFNIQACLRATCSPIFVRIGWGLGLNCRGRYRISDLISIIQNLRNPPTFERETIQILNNAAVHTRTVGAK
ncbi:hypothetical protein DFH07DRAFT_777008 [Mycena maculata]|uniref:Uncharacterized protein n=1 Tax=Mycena maculata TaxID=230809 RepID=A0AAD7N3T0_9AGAR|nr:hypothetical protein DFH07DRAFT_777008 [Mycena maculata]